MGFLPNRSLADVEEALREAVRSSGDAWLADHHTFTFDKLRNDAYKIPGDHPLPVAVQAACRSAGLESEVFGWNVSCDARLYAKVGRLPTVVFGPGDIRQAHAADESVDLGEVVTAAGVLARFMVSWCGARRG